MNCTPSKWGRPENGFLLTFETGRNMGIFKRWFEKFKKNICKHVKLVGVL